MASKTEFFSEHLFLKIRGQGHSFFQIRLFTLRTVFPTSQLGVGEGEDGGERAYGYSLHALLFREVTPLLVESLAWGTRKRIDYMGMVQAQELLFIFNLPLYTFFFFLLLFQHQSTGLQRRPRIAPVSMDPEWGK